MNILDSYDIERKDDGTFLYKAKPFEIKKPKEQDPYHFPIVKKLEDEFNKQGIECHKQIVVDIVEFLKTI